MPRRRFCPSTGQICWLAAVGGAAIGAALYLRYRVIEVSTVGLACDGGLKSWTCEFRRVATMMFNNSVFSYVALIAAALLLVQSPASANLIAAALLTLLLAAIRNAWDMMVWIVIKIPAGGPPSP